MEESDSFGTDKDFRDSLESDSKPPKIIEENIDESGTA
jgi:hypothetical protein